MSDVTIHDISWRTTADYRHTFVVQDDDGNPYDMTGSTFACDFKTAPGATATLSLASGSGLTLGGTDDNEIEMVVEAGDLAPGIYGYELIRKNGSAREYIVAGTVTITEGFTTS